MIIQGLKRKNLRITGVESKPFFFTGG